MDYKTFIEAMDDLAMGIGDIADRLEITVEEVQKWNLWNLFHKKQSIFMRWSKKIKLSKIRLI